MLTGNDFVILSEREICLLYSALMVGREKATYKELQEIGILSITDDIRKFLNRNTGA